MKNKLKKVALSAGIAAVGALSLASCGESDAEKKAREAQEAQERKKIEALRQDSIRQEQEKVQRADELYFDHVRDSVQQSKGYDRAKDIGYHAAEGRLLILKNYTQSVLLNDRVQKLYIDAAGEYNAEVQSFLAKYGIEMRKQIETVPYLVPQYNSGNVEESALDLEQAGWGLYDMPENFGTTRATEVRDGVKNILNKYAKSIYQRRKKIEKEFSDYYPILDLSKIPAKYRNYFVGREYFNGDGYYLDRRLVVTRSVSVYDSKLDVNFFGEPGAKYELKSEGKGKWRVIRTNADGTVSKTPIFNHNVGFGTSGFTAPVVDENGKVLPKPGNEFGFRPGDNKGVHVSFSEVLYVKDPEKIDDKAPDKDGKRAKEIEELEAIVAECEKHIAIRQHADSVARAMLKERQAKR